MPHRFRDFAVQSRNSLTVAALIRVTGGIVDAAWLETRKKDLAPLVRHPREVGLELTARPGRSEVPTKNSRKRARGRRERRRRSFSHEAASCWRWRHDAHDTGTEFCPAPAREFQARARRTIELPACCVAALKAHMERQRREKQLAGTRWVESGYVFTSTIGTPIDDGKILKEFKALVEAAKLPKQRFHDLRRACISLLGAQGIPLKVIADIVGHSDIRLTQNVYQHVYQEARLDPAEEMDMLLSEAAGGTPVSTSVATTSPFKSLGLPLNY
jgi:hypothetical protein